MKQRDNSYLMFVFTAIIIASISFSTYNLSKPTVLEVDFLKANSLEEIEVTETIEKEEVILDEDLKIVYKGIKKKVSSHYGEVVEFIFEASNESDKNLDIYSEYVSLNGSMIKNPIYQETISIAKGKSSELKVSFSEYEGSLPELKGELEFQVTVFEWEKEPVSFPIKINLE